MGEREGTGTGKIISIAELESESGGAPKELGPQDRVRLKIASNVLLFIVALVVLASLAMIYAPDERVKQAEIIFEFVKTIAPPIVTLVIGFYFRDANS